MFKLWEHAICTRMQYEQIHSHVFLWGCWLFYVTTQHRTIDEGGCSLLPPSLYWKAPDSHQHNVLCDYYWKEALSLQRMLMIFKPNQAFIKQRGVFFFLVPLNYTELCMNLQGGGVDVDDAHSRERTTARHSEECIVEAVHERLEVCRSPTSRHTTFFPSTWGRHSPSWCSGTADNGTLQW